MGRASQATLERAAALAGPYVEQRLRTLRAGADLFRRSPGLTAAINGPLRAARRALAAFPQLGDAGAHRMLLFASNYPVLPIDARVHRVAVRLGYGSRDLHAGHSAHAIRRALSRELPRDVEAVRRAYLYLSHHGAATCTEADPHCIVCPLLAECPDGRTRLEI
jgi:endonuclease-3